MPKRGDRVACPDCGYRRSRVLDSRGTDRLRRCDDCGACWETYEDFKRRRDRDARQLNHKRNAA